MALSFKGTSVDSNLKKAVEIMGGEPINEMGSCFDAAAMTFCSPGQDIVPTDRLCHGLGIANMPGQEGEIIAHAWIEFDRGGTRFAYEAIWGVVIPAKNLRSDLKVSYVVEYTVEEVRKNWTIHNMPGPWDEKIKNFLLKNLL